MPGISRRTLLRLTAGAAPAAWLTGCQTRTEGSGPSSARQHPVVAGDYRYLKASEIAFVDAAVSRMIPSDNLGPGAAEAGVTLFIDHQLAGPYGQAARWYMQGPFEKGIPEQGYQLKQTPAQLYREAIAAIDAHCRKTYGEKTFAELGEAEQDVLLDALDKEHVKLPDVSGKGFIEMLWKNTQEGFFADPMYEGNRDFIGWKLVGYTGPRYNYVGNISHFGQEYRLPTVGLMGRDPSRRPENAA